ncbi:uncharacterized protein C8R40DRAFT_993626, partial [Lentinula edodes]|uniref:uncharacterized protein n=1 Tax=Lentinula edodes TaxID=5353 RepID=UPI001E8E83D0
MELGGPMISIYLLGNPDHYTDHHFVTFYWIDFVNEARRYWHPDDIRSEKQKVTLMKRNGKIVGMSPVYDYMYRGENLAQMSLYEW